MSLSSIVHVALVRSWRRLWARGGGFLGLLEGRGWAAWVRVEELVGFAEASCSARTVLEGLAIACQGVLKNTKVTPTTAPIFQMCVLMCLYWLLRCALMPSLWHVFCCATTHIT